MAAIADNDSFMATVILTGFMGTGKSSVGRKLAARLNESFVDTDDLIERSEGSSISEIFVSKGEGYFRAAERRAINRALKVPDAVIATGGGAIVDPDNFARLHAEAPIVCLSARPEVILNRTCSAKTTRPLLENAEPQERIETLLAQRAPAYAKADLTVDTSDRSIDEIVDEVVAFLRRVSPTPGSSA